MAAEKEDIPGPVAGTKDAMVNLSGIIDYSRVSVLNADSKANLKGILKGEDGAAVRSDADVDHQLLIFVSFQEAVKLHGLGFKTPASSTDAKASGPKTVKLFVGATNLDFESAASAAPTQAFALKPEHLDGRELLTTFVKFQNVLQLTLFIETNQKDTAVTVLNGLSFIGAPKAGFNVAAIKKIDDH